MGLSCGQSGPKQVQKISGGKSGEFIKEPALQNCAPSLLPFMQRTSDFLAPAVRCIAKCQSVNGLSGLLPPAAYTNAEATRACSTGISAAQRFSPDLSFDGSNIRRI